MRGEHYSWPELLTTQAQADSVGPAERESPDAGRRVAPEPGFEPTTAVIRHSKRPRRGRRENASS